MRAIVTGSAGFIGSHLVDFLLKQKISVLGIDNFSTGKERFLNTALMDSNFNLEKMDLLESEKLEKICNQFKPEIVFHLAANADVRFGLNHPKKDLEQGTIVTANVLEAARKSGVQKFCYSSTGSVYGEPKVFPTPEDCPFPVQTSLYAASKVAGETLIQAYAHGFGMSAYIFRFVSILGPRYTHGHVFDFLKKLRTNALSIDILGDGKQKKAYLHVDDCIRAIWTILEGSQEKVNIFNLGPDEYVSVDQSLDVICNTLNLSPKRIYSGGERGWIGDSPFIFLDCKKLKGLGWQAQKSIRQSVKDTVDYLTLNSELLK